MTEGVYGKSSETPRKGATIRMKADCKRKLSSREWNAIYETIAAECVVKEVHVMLYIMLKRGWHKDRIHRYFDDILALYRMGEVFGKVLTDADVIEYVDKYSGISPEEWKALESSVQVIVEDPEKERKTLKIWR